MNMKITFRKKWWSVVMGLLLVTSCREDFDISYESKDTSPILVVEGYIDVSGLQSTYTLSYAQSLGENSEFISWPIVHSGVVTIESEQGVKYYSTNMGEGRFVIPHPILDVQQRYRLHIQIDDREYQSEFVEVKISPEISSLEWAETENGVQVFVSTDDPTGNSKYYRWEFDETWKYFSGYRSSIILENSTVRYRAPEELVHSCFSFANSTSIYTATSADLSRDAIYRFPLAHIPRLSEKLSDRYSVLVRQIAITEAGYSYWTQVRESSENLGDLFGPMPSELVGNIVCLTHPDYHVIGLAEAAHVTEKRLFIDRSELSGFWQVKDDYYNGCPLLTEDLRTGYNFVVANPNYMLIDEVAVNPESPYPTHYTLSLKRCVDCSIKGGQIASPDFWQE